MRKSKLKENELVGPNDGFWERHSKPASPNFSAKLLRESKKALLQQAEASGKTATQLLEEWILGAQKFSPSIERWIGGEKEARGKSRRQIIEEVLEWAAQNGWAASSLSADTKPKDRRINSRARDALENNAATDILLRSSVRDGTSPTIPKPVSASPPPAPPTGKPSARDRRRRSAP